jgi:hypothetical protein
MSRLDVERVKKAEARIKGNERQVLSCPSCTSNSPLKKRGGKERQ